jgi:hypothetical protein
MIFHENSNFTTLPKLGTHDLTFFRQRLTQLKTHQQEICPH